MSELKEFRQLVGISQFRLAHESGVPRQYLQLAEGGLRTLNPEQKRQVQKVLVAELRRRAVLIQQILAREECMEART